MFPRNSYPRRSAGHRSVTTHSVGTRHFRPPNQRRQLSRRIRRDAECRYTWFHRHYSRDIDLHAVLKRKALDRLPDGQEDRDYHREVPAERSLSGKEAHHAESRSAEPVSVFVSPARV